MLFYQRVMLLSSLISVVVALAYHDRWSKVNKASRRPGPCGVVPDSNQQLGDSNAPGSWPQISPETISKWGRA